MQDLKTGTSLLLLSPTVPVLCGTFTMHMLCIKQHKADRELIHCRLFRPKFLHCIRKKKKKFQQRIKKKHKILNKTMFLFSEKSNICDDVK